MLPAGMELGDGTTPLPLHARARALREAALAVSLCHPHLLATLDVQLQPLAVMQGAQASQQGLMMGQQQGLLERQDNGASIGSKLPAGVGAWRLCLVQVSY